MEEEVVEDTVEITKEQMIITDRVVITMVLPSEEKEDNTLQITNGIPAPVISDHLIILFERVTCVIRIGKTELYEYL